MILKIEALILMIQTEIIMIINLKKKYTNNVLKSNDIICLDYLCFSDFSAPAISWSIPLSNRREDFYILMVELIRQLNAEPANFLLGMDVKLSALQPDNKIIRHKGLRGILTDRYQFIEKGKYFYEKIEQVENRIRISGVFCDKTDNLEKFVNIASSEKGSFLFLLADKFICDFYENYKTYSPGTQNSKNIEFIVNHLGVIFLFLGSFDDPYSEVIAIGNDSIISRLCVV